SGRQSEPGASAASDRVGRSAEVIAAPFLEKPYARPLSAADARKLDPDRCPADLHRPDHYRCRTVVATDDGNPEHLAQYALGKDASPCHRSGLETVPAALGGDRQDCQPVVPEPRV